MTQLLIPDFGPKQHKKRIVQQMSNSINSANYCADVEDESAEDAPLRVYRDASATDMVVEVQGRHMVYFEAVVVVRVLVCLTFEKGARVDCRHDVDVVMGVI